MNDKSLNKNNNKNSRSGFKPKKGAFIYYPFTMGIISALFTFIFLIGVSLWVQNTIFTIIVSLIFLVSIFSTSFGLFARFVQFKKESYFINEDSITLQTGGIFGNKNTTLPVHKITNVSHSTNYIENKIFKTSTIFVDSAGSSDESIVFKSIENGDNVEEEIRKLLYRNGIDVSENNLIAQTAPTQFAILIESGSRLFGMLSFFAFLIYFNIGGIYAGSSGDFDLPFSQTIILLLGVGFFILTIFLPTIISLIFRFFDLKNTEYFVYENILVYKNGFFNKHKAFLPLRNLTDTELKQHFLERFLDVEDISISTKGKKDFLEFKYLKEARSFEQALDQQIKNGEKLAEHEETISVDIEGKQNQEQKESQNKQDTHRTNHGIVGKEKHLNQKDDKQEEEKEEVVYSLRPNFLRAIFGAISPFILFLPFLLIFLWIPEAGFIWLMFVFISTLTMITSIVKLFFTDYVLTTSSVKCKVNMLNRSEVDISLSKITAFVVGQNLIDRVFNTISVQFFSQSAGTSITFAFVHKDRIDIHSLAKFLHLEADIQNDSLHKQNGEMDQTTSSLRSNPVMTYVPRFNFLFFIGYITPVLTIITIVIAVIFGIIALIVQEELAFMVLSLSLLLFVLVYIITNLVSALIHCNTAGLEIFPMYTYFKKGFVMKKEFYARNQFIKHTDVITVKPSNFGVINFSIVGGVAKLTKEEQKNNGMQTNLVTSPDFKIQYIENVLQQDKKITKHLLSFHGVAGIDDENTTNATKLKTKQESHVFKPKVSQLAFMSSLFIVPIIIMPYLIIVFRQTEYIISAYTVMKNQGFYYKTSTTILKTNIDYAETHKNFINDIYNTGNISIYTESGGGVEMVINNIPNYNKANKLLNNG